MVTVHHLENSRSQRILWLLEELGVEYEVKRYDRDKKTSLAPPELLKIHPLGKSPVITDGDVTVAESGAITEYLAEKYGDQRLLPAAGTPERLKHTYWLHYAEGTFMPLMVMSLIMNRISTAPMPFFVKPIAKGIVSKVYESFLTPNTTRNLQFMEQSLTENPWFCGSEMTAADTLMSFPVEAAATRADMSNYPKLRAFLETTQARPAYQRALEKGGPYSILSSGKQDK
jgi:glutathione S-transferase